MLNKILISVICLLIFAVCLNSKLSAREWSDPIQVTWVNEGIEERPFSICRGTSAFFGIDGKIHVFFGTNSPEVDNIVSPNIFQVILDTTGTVLDTLIQYTFHNPRISGSDVEVDESGFAHYLYKVSSDTDSLLYMKINPLGELVLGPMLADVNTIWRNPCGDQICVDENGNAVFMYYRSNDLHVKRITPEREVQEIAIVECEDFYFTTMDIGPDGDIHFTGEGDIFLGKWIPYMRISSEGDIIVEPTPISPIIQDMGYIGMNIKIDANNNIHIAHDGENLLDYMMLSEDLDTLSIISQHYLCSYKRFLEIDDEGIVHYTWEHSLQGWQTANYYMTIRDGEILDEPYEIPYIGSLILNSLDIKDNKRLILRGEGRNPDPRFNSREQYIYLYPFTNNNVNENPFSNQKAFFFCAFPNPFNDRCLIDFTLNRRSLLDLSIFDITGRKTFDVYQGQLSAGKYQFLWNGEDQFGTVVPNGTYFIRILMNGAEAHCRTINMLPKNCKYIYDSQIIKNFDSCLFFIPQICDLVCLQQELC